MNMSSPAVSHPRSSIRTSGTPQRPLRPDSDLRIVTPMPPAAAFPSRPSNSSFSDRLGGVNVSPISVYLKEPRYSASSRKSGKRDCRDVFSHDGRPRTNSFHTTTDGVVSSKDFAAEPSYPNLSHPHLSNAWGGRHGVFQQQYVRMPPKAKCRGSRVPVDVELMEIGGNRPTHKGRKSTFVKKIAICIVLVIAAAILAGCLWALVQSVINFNNEKQQDSRHDN